MLEQQFRNILIRFNLGICTIYASYDKNIMYVIYNL